MQEGNTHMKTKTHVVLLAVAVPVPARAVMFFVNLVTDDGLVVSTRIFTRE